MQHQLFLDSIARHVTLSPEEQATMAAALKTKKIKRRQLLFREGDIHKHLVFVTEGCLRSYSIDKNGFEHILQFAPPGWWISDISSMIKQEPGTLTIDAVDDSEVLLLLRSDLENFFLYIPQLERFFRIISENALANYQHRLIDSLSLSALERYDNFCRLYPSLIQCLPQKQVAAYIGVTPEFLSKMLHRAATKKPTLD